MILPHSRHLLNRNSFRLWQQEVNENRHDQDQNGEEVEQTKLHVAKHRHEELSNEESEEHVHGHVQRLSRRSDFQWTYLTRH